MFGNYKTSGTDTLEIIDLLHTLRDCLDGSINTWESTFFISLSTASNYTIEGKILTIESTNGKKLVFFVELVNRQKIKITRYLLMLFQKLSAFEVTLKHSLKVTSNFAPSKKKLHNKSNILK